MVPRVPSAEVMRNARPVARSDLVRDLRALGVQPGGVLMVHTRMSAIGWVVGGAETVVTALLDVLGPAGTLMAYVGWNDSSGGLAYRRSAVESWLRAGLAAGQARRGRRAGPAARCAAGPADDPSPCRVPSGQPGEADGKSCDPRSGGRPGRLAGGLRPRHVHGDWRLPLWTGSGRPGSVCRHRPAGARRGMRSCRSGR